MKWGASCAIYKGAALQSELMRVRRVANMLDVTAKRVYQMVTEGKIEAVKIGPRSMRIVRDSVDRYMEGNRIQPREGAAQHTTKESEGA